MSDYSSLRIVGFSNTPTLYRMILPQRGDVYVMCGADILINGLKTDLGAEAKCPVCGSVTSFQIAQRLIEDLAPWSRRFTWSNSRWGRDALAYSVNQLIFLTRKIASPSGYQPIPESQA